MKQQGSNIDFKISAGDETEGGRLIEVLYTTGGRKDASKDPEGVTAS